MTDFVDPDNMGFWSQVLGKKVETAEEFYNELFKVDKLHPEMAPYCVSLIRTDCILGHLLVAVFYENGKAIRYLECDTKRPSWLDEIDKKSLNTKDPSGQLYQKSLEEYLLRQQPTYSFPSLGLTFKVGDDYADVGTTNSDGIWVTSRSPQLWADDAQPVTKEQFDGLLTLLQDDYKGLGKKWTDLDWEAWGK